MQRLRRRSGGGVLFLTNNLNAIKLYNWLAERCLTYIYSRKLNIETVKALEPELIISYNFNYLINSEIIEYMKGKIINLHISYLPWNPMDAIASFNPWNSADIPT